MHNFSETFMQFVVKYVQLAKWSNSRKWKRACNPLRHPGGVPVNLAAKQRGSSVRCSRARFIQQWTWAKLESQNGYAYQVIRLTKWLRLYFGRPIKQSVRNCAVSWWGITSGQFCELFPIGCWMWWWLLHTSVSRPWKTHVHHGIGCSPGSTESSRGSYWGEFNFFHSGRRSPIALS